MVAASAAASCVWGTSRVGATVWVGAASRVGATVWVGATVIVGAAVWAAGIGRARAEGPAPLSVTDLRARGETEGAVAAAFKVLTGAMAVLA